MLSSHVIRRGYPKYLVKNSMTKAELKDRDTLLAKDSPDKITLEKGLSTTTPELTFYLVTTHNPSNPPLRKIVETNWALLSKSKTTRPLENAKIIFGQRRNKNLSDHLVRASTQSTHTNSSNLERNPCKRSRTCRYCPIINTSGQIISTTTGRRFNTMKNVKCKLSKLKLNLRNNMQFF